MIRMTKLLALSCFVLFIQQCHAQELTDPKQNDDVIEEGILGQLKVTGEIPKLPPLLKKEQLTLDQMCSNKEIPDESLLVSKDGGLANAFVYLKKLPEDLEIPKLKRESSLLCKGCRFRPHAQIVSVGQPFSLINEDPIAINVRLSGFANILIHTLASHSSDRENDVHPYIFKNPESMPIRVKDDFHPWAKAWVLPLDHPFAAVTDKSGKFAIQGLRSGIYEFVVWHERAGWLEKLLSIEVKEDKPTKIQLTYPADRFMVKQTLDGKIISRC